MVIDFKAAALEMSENGPVLNLAVEGGSLDNAKTLVDKITSTGKVWRADCKPIAQKRSLSANAYCWVLCDKIAQAVKSEKEEVYRDAIRRVGAFQALAVQEEALDAFCERWASTGVGYICEVIGPGDAPGMVDVCAYFGSSTYSSAEMAALLDDLIDTAKGMGVETLPPDEVARIESLWRVEE